MVQEIQIFIKNEIENVKKLIDANVPIFAVGLGHYLLTI